VSDPLGELAAKARISGSPRHVLVDWNTPESAHLIALAPELAVLCADLADALRREIDPRCADDPCPMGIARVMCATCVSSHAALAAYDALGVG
jgi:hypothetical protein